MLVRWLGESKAGQTGADEGREAHQVVQRLVFDADHQRGRGAGRATLRAAQGEQAQWSAREKRQQSPDEGSGLERCARKTPTRKVLYIPGHLV